MTEAGWTVCIECGMVCEAVEYHPYAACLMFKQCHNSETVRANLQAVRDDSYQQGRVEGLRESMDDLRKRMDRDDGDTDNDVWKHLAWCELQIKAQAAQDEKGVGEL